MQCENCGASLPDGVKTCVKCGARTDVSTFAANVGAPMAQPKQDKVPVPRKSGLFVPTMVLLLIVFLAWLLFQWLTAR